MKFILPLLALFISAICFNTSEAALLFPYKGNGPPITASCPIGSPSPDGSTIFPVGAGQISCVLTDKDGFLFRFNVDFLEDSVNSGASWNTVGRYGELQINSGGREFVPIACGGGAVAPFGLWMWNNGDGFGSPVISPTQLPSPAPFSIGASFSTHYQFIGAGQTETVSALQGGLPAWVVNTGRITASNVTVNIASGATVGCGQDETRAIFPVDTGGGAVDNVTITGAGDNVSAIGISPFYVCVDFQNATNWTISDIYVHDCNFGLQAKMSTTGTTGTITNVVFDHNGGNVGGGSATHNVYLGFYDPTKLSTIAVSGKGSYCTNGNDVGPGFEFKTRFVGGTFQNWTAASPSQHGFTDCYESAAVDLSCGGHYTLGGTTTGTGVVLEVHDLAHGGPQGFELVRYGRDDTTGNCGAGSTPWPDSACNTVFGENCKLLIQNCWLINDSPTNISVVTIDNTIPSGRVTVKNCKIVQGSTGTIASLASSGITDGGGNTIYASRTAAGLGAYPSLPSPP